MYQQPIYKFSGECGNLEGGGSEFVSLKLNFSQDCRDSGQLNNILAFPSLLLEQNIISFFRVAEVVYNNYHYLIIIIIN